MRTLTFKLFAIILLLIAGRYDLNCAYAEEVGARSAVVIDGTTERILYAKNPEWKQPPASTTKLVTAMVVLDNINPDSFLTVSEKAAGTPSVSPHLRAGERFKVKDMLYLALMRSVNSAAVALAEAAAGSEEKFSVLMNEKASVIGAENTHFINASGLPGPGQYITAFDLAKIMKEALKYPLIKEIINTRTTDIYSTGGRRIFVRNTDQLLWRDDDVLGGKTGYTRAARHCFVGAAQKDGTILISAVLGESVRDDLWHDSQILLARGYDVTAQKAEPLIYFTRINADKQNPVVLASYKGGNGHKKHRVARHHKRRSDSHMRVAKKGKKSQGRNLS
jgi:D-alanyl-D-alanine carboxypeptidase (penicillin-binding protein 5/6)